LPAKVQRVCHVNSTIHEAKTVSWGYLQQQQQKNSKAMTQQSQK